VPFAALGLFFLIFWGVRKLNEQARVAVATIAFLIASVPNFYHIYDYKIPTVFSNTLAKQLTELGKIAGREDYVFAWWDYGYPIRYYSDVKNHSDGGKHDGSTNFIESFILGSTSQRAAANMMRESVEGYEELIKKGEEQNRSTLEYLLSKKGIEPKNYQDYLASLKSEEFKAATKTRDVYLFLPFEMFEIFPTVKLFSDVDLISGQQASEPYFGLFLDFVENEDSIDLGGVVFDKKTNTIKMGQNKLSLKTISSSYYDKNGSLVTKTQKLSETAEFHLIALPSHHAYILADDASFNSLFVQLFVFENYDKNLFEKVSSTPEAKIFRLKI
jgi:dolichyl-diphosphooligosaccharide--protein glycosyltransferase/undecaprenyl-diphosphooligosaccharide--protein glycosyltransferase